MTTMEIMVKKVTMIMGMMNMATRKFGKSAGGAKPSTAAVISGIIKNEGVTTLYNGLSAGLLRQASYTTTRLGIYTWLFETFSTEGKPPGFFMKAALGMTAGGIGAFVGTPAEVALIRMTSDGSLPADQRRNYSSVFNALARIYKEEGVATLWKGATPTIARYQPQHTCFNDNVTFQCAGRWL